MQKKPPEGSKVFIRHYRCVELFTDEKHPEDTTVSVIMPAKEIREEGLIPKPTGGRTVALVTLPDGREALGEADCSKKDNFNRVIGRNIAIGRALKELGY